MKKIFTFLVAVLFAGIFSASAEKVTQDFYLDDKEVFESEETEMIRDADGSYTITNFFESGDPLSFTFDEIAVGKYSSIKITSPFSIYGAGFEDYPYLENEKGEPISCMGYDINDGSDFPLYYPVVYLKNSWVGRYDKEEYGYDYCLQIELYGYDENDDETDYYDVIVWFNELPVPPATNYYLVGAFNGWKPDDEVTKFTLGSDGLYAFDYEGDFAGEFVITNGTWDVKYATNGNKLTPAEPYELKLGGGNISLSVDILKNPHFVFDPNEAKPTLTVTGEAAEAKAAYAIKGEIFGESWPTEPMTETDGVWTLTKEAGEGGFLIIKFLEGVEGEQGWIKSGDTDHTVVLGTAMAAVDNGGDNWNLSKAGTYLFTYDPAKGTLTVSDGSGVIGIDADNDAPVEFFNLQGVKVANPENGVFIRRQGSKVSKVVR